MSGLGQSAPPTDAPVVDTAEQVRFITKLNSIMIDLDLQSLSNFPHNTRND